jgi:aldehyde:ferredoxin oxidoreductase
MTTFNGWYGKILRVNLTEQTYTIETVDPQMAKDYIGGRGWAIKYLMDGMDPAVDALSPENMLIFATGPLTGSPAPTGNRYMVVTKSPLTGVLTNSNSGGDFPTWMKRTGFDLFIFEGRAAEPVYLWVDDDQIEIRPADHIWGKQVPESTDMMLAETHKKAKVACIGPAGERLVKAAAIMNDKDRAAARSGVGAVMGSKNLKGVVAMGTHQIGMADYDGMQTFGRAMSREVGEASKTSVLRIYGTPYVPDVTNEMGILPTRNFQTGRFEGVENINGPALNANFLLRPGACHRCPIVCNRITKVDTPGYEGEGEGPEYESIGALGSSCGVDNLAAITKANYLCNEYGMDTITVGMTISCAMEMYEAGIIPESDIGEPLKFGDADGMIKFLKKMAMREGFGDKLAEGSYALAESYGHPEYSMSAKKLEFPGYDPRGAKGMGLLYATSNIGASHMMGDLAYAEVFGTPEKIDPLTIENKPALIKRWEDSFAIIDSAGLCVFMAVRYAFDKNPMIMPDRLTKLMNLTTGADYTPETLMQAAERVYNLERLFLLKAGITKADDTLPPRFLEEPLTEGPAAGHVAETEKMLPKFYELRGWDEDGIPTPEKLQELGLA